MNVVVFAIRGCPAGWLGAYGNEWVGTPNLDRFAAEAVVFDRHVSDDPEPAAAGRAWFGGAALPVLAALRDASVRTVLIRANHPDTDGPEWYYAPWAEVFDARPQDEDGSPLDELMRAFPDVLDRLSGGSNFLLWVEIDRLLPPWDVPQDVFEAYLNLDDEEAESDAAKSDPDDNSTDDESVAGVSDDVSEEDDEPEPTATPKPVEPVTPWSDPPPGLFDNRDPDVREWLHASFAAVVTQLDAEIGALFHHLRARGLDDSAAWVVTSDFGYPLGEHGQLGPRRPWLHEELVHLPLLVRLPGAVEAGRRVDAFTQPPDLATTLLDLLGVGIAQPLPGHNLRPLARGEVEAIRQHAFTTLSLGAASEAAMRTDEWALLVPLEIPAGETRAPSMFAKPDDRWEVNDIRIHNIGIADELEVRIRQQLHEQ